MDDNYLYDDFGDETVTYSKGNDYDLYNQYQNLPVVPVSNYPTHESPFTSNTAATPAAIRTAHNSRSDTRLKNRLFGVGTNGGFLTSPVIKGHTRAASGVENNPTIVDFSNNHYANANSQFDMNFQQMTDQSQFGGAENAYPAGDYQVNLNYAAAPPVPIQYTTRPNVNVAGQTGLGMDGLDMADYAGANMQIYGVPIDQNKSPNSQAAAPPAFMPYPDQVPTTTVGRGKKIRDVGPLDLPKPRSAGPGSPPPSTRSPKTKNRKLLTVRTASVTSPKLGRTPRKAVSSPCLKSISVAPHHYPMTPNQKSGFDQALDFLNYDPIAPFNTPAQHGQTPKPISEPFSFADLYNLGLVEGGPMDFSSVVDKNFDPNMPLSIDDPFSPPLSAVSSSLSNSMEDYAFLQALPTPALVGESCFSSPASAWSVSPALSPAESSGSGMHSQSFENMSTFATPVLSPAYSNVSLHEQFNMDALFSPVMPDFNAMLNLTVMDPALQVNNFAQLPDLPVASTSQHQMMPSTSAPMMPSASNQMLPWEHNLMNMQPLAQTPDFLLVDPYAAPPQPARRVASLNRKRSRDDFDAEQSEDEDDEDEYVPQDMPSPQSKKQRTVSAPVVGRRLKPGPKPKPKASMDNLAQQARSGSIGPPPSQLLAQVLSQVSTDNGHDHSQCGSDCEEDGVGLPKSVIRSLYQPMAPQAGKTGKRYVCLIEGCGRIFPRKSAIESHIQTHLEDKPFVCSIEDW